MRSKLFIFFLFISFISTAQKAKTSFSRTPAEIWADSVYETLTAEQRIAQLMIIRLSTYDSKARKAVFFDSAVTEQIKKYNIGGVCLFQGDPARQATVINSLQRIAQTPLMVCIDAEWGVGMRMFDSVTALPHQMMLGAVQNADIIYDYGKLVARQCRRLGINVNYAPVIDINNNPDNPVINDRSFGENKYRVALLGSRYMQGMQDEGVMACAKHFPGHGDVNTDSHFDLPVINRSFSSIDSLELYPFKELISKGVASMMIAHLYIPSIDSAANRATSISRKTVAGLLRNKLGFTGLTFTDALEMQGVKKYFPDGVSSVESLIAGNDMLCLPGDVAVCIKKIKKAIKKHKLSKAEIELHCKKVLQYKYEYGSAGFSPVDTENITQDLNKGIPEMKKRVAENAITLLKQTNETLYCLDKTSGSSAPEIAYVGIGLSGDNFFAKKMRTELNASVFYFNYKQDASRILSMVELIRSKYKKVVIGVHAYNRTPANNFGISAAAVNLVNALQEKTNGITLVFGNPYAIKNFCTAKDLVACYEDDVYTQSVALDLLQGKLQAKGKLPVTVCTEYKSGDGIILTKKDRITFSVANPDEVGMDVVKLHVVDSIADDAVKAGATPGCVVLVVKNGKLCYQKAFGNRVYDASEKMNSRDVFDIASVTKICATTLAVMKLYEEKKIDLQKTLGDYLPWVKNSDKAKLMIRDLMLHQAGLVPFIPFYKETLTAPGVPDEKYFHATRDALYSIPVAQDLYMRKGHVDTMYSRIAQSPLTASGKYVYSDNDFIFLGKIVETVSGKALDEYVQEKFYKPMGLTKTGFRPKEFLSVDDIVPSELDTAFRHRLLQGDVNDPGAAMFGGVAGHAGLFSNAEEMAMLMQMLLNGGILNGKKYFEPETVRLFTGYGGTLSRRGLGFDKPEKNNAIRKEPYPCISASAATFGHLGYTGTCIWADPVKQLIYVFLSNRLMAKGDNKKLLNMNVRGKIFEAIYEAVIKQ